MQRSESADEPLAHLLRVLLRASELLAESFDFREGLQKLAQMMVENAADICLVDIMEEGEIVRLAATHRDPQLQRAVDELRDRYPPVLGGPHPVARVVETLEPEWRAVMSREFLVETTQDERHLELALTLRFGSYVTVPIAARNDVMGALSVIREEGREPFGEEDVELIADLAHRAAVHLHNARLYEQRDEAVWRLRRLQDLTDFSQLALPTDELIDEVIHRLRRAVDADTVRILLASDDGRALHGGGAIGLGDPSQWRDELPVGEGFAGHIASTRRPLIIEPPTADLEILSPALRRLAHVAGVPLLVGDELIGVVHVGHREPHGFDDEDLQLLLLAADRIALAIDQNRRFRVERQKTLALQGSLLPATLPPVPKCRVCARYLPADSASAIGGDFYDVFDVDEGVTGVLVGDVAGKGIPAAALVGLARHTVRAAARHTQSALTPLVWLHEAFRDVSADDYCTAIYGRLTPVAGGVQLSFAVGGHPLPVVVRADGSVQSIGQPGTALGLLPEARLHESTVDLQPGDLLVLYTDGVTDTPESPMTTDQFGELVAGLSGDDPESICDELEHSLRDLRAEQADDIALLLIAVQV
ncbi:MAG TPA: SpoIIE family protein phosphatase [Acidimicrobiia bacterium]